MQNAMTRILQEFIHAKTRPFSDDIPIKGCLYVEKNDIVRPNGLRQFVWKHLCNVEAILPKVIKVGLTLSGEKSSFGLNEVMVVNQICRANERRPCKVKVDVINEIQDCQTTYEVRRFFGACIFNKIWIANFPHIADPLYEFLRKNMKIVEEGTT
jgi:hypothetical protein